MNVKDADIFFIDPWALPCVALIDRANLPSDAGVYFVFADDHLLYIGKAGKGLSARWKGHHRGYEFKVAAQSASVRIAYWVATETCFNLPRLEKLLIKKFKPSLNDTTIEDEFRRVDCGTLRAACDVDAKTWHQWKKEINVSEHVRFLTIHEALLLACKIEWTKVKAEYDLDTDTPKDWQILNYGFQWLELYGMHTGSMIRLIFGSHLVSTACSAGIQKLIGLSEYESKIHSKWLFSSMGEIGRNLLPDRIDEVWYKIRP